MNMAFLKYEVKKGNLDPEVKLRICVLGQCSIGSYAYHMFLPQLVFLTLTETLLLLPFSIAETTSFMRYELPI